MKTRKKNGYSGKRFRPAYANHSPESSSDQPCPMLQELAQRIQRDINNLKSAPSGAAATPPRQAAGPIHFNGHSVNLGPIHCTLITGQEYHAVPETANWLQEANKLLAAKNEQIKTLKHHIQSLEEQIFPEQLMQS